jgi:cephalosporin-C deacetylase-like acetyl esterase
LLAWVRAQDAPAVGVYGLSLGGYNAALLASLEPELACVIAGIPATDLTALTQRLDSPYKLERFKQADFAWEQIEEILRVVSPLALSPKVPLERRYIFGGAVDRLIPPSQVWALWQHWERPRILWYAGSHVSIHWEPKVRALVREALRDSALVPA